MPQDVAVVGFDDVPLASYSDPPLTTIRQPLREMGELAARLLLAHLAGEPLPELATTIPTSLIVRASTLDAQP